MLLRVQLAALLLLSTSCASQTLKASSTVSQEQDEDDEEASGGLLLWQKKAEWFSPEGDQPLQDRWAGLPEGPGSEANSITGSSSSSSLSSLTSPSAQQVGASQKKPALLALIEEKSHTKTSLFSAEKQSSGDATETGETSSAATSEKDEGKSKTVEKKETIHGGWKMETTAEEKDIVAHRNDEKKADDLAAEEAVDTDETIRGWDGSPQKRPQQQIQPDKTSPTTGNNDANVTTTTTSEQKSSSTFGGAVPAVVSGLIQEASRVALSSNSAASSKTTATATAGSPYFSDSQQPNWRVNQRGGYAYISSYDRAGSSGNPVSLAMWVTYGWLIAMAALGCIGSILFKEIHHAQDDVVGGNDYPKAPGYVWRLAD